MPNQLFKSFQVGLQRRWWSGLKYGFGAVGAAWTVTEVATAALPAAKLFFDAHGPDYTHVLIALFVGVFVGYIYETRTVTFKLPTTDTYITIKYGDLFDEDANFLVGVNEFFDGALGHAVKPTSVHGQFITRYFGSDANGFHNAVSAALSGRPATATTRSGGPSDSYPIGTTAVVRAGSKRAFLVAMALTDHATSKASSTVPMLWDAVRQALEAVHNYGNGDPLALPLLGNGQASINIEPQHLLRLITLALVDFGRNIQLPKHVSIVLHDDCFDKLDIREIQRDWTKR